MAKLVPGNESRNRLLSCLPDLNWSKPVYCSHKQRREGFSESLVKWQYWLKVTSILTYIHHISCICLEHAPSALLPAFWTIALRQFSRSFSTYLSYQRSLFREKNSLNTFLSTFYILHSSQWWGTHPAVNRFSFLMMFQGTIYGSRDQTRSLACKTSNLTCYAISLA